MWAKENEHIFQVSVALLESQISRFLQARKYYHVVVHPEKRQLNVNLPATLINEVKHQVIDSRHTLAEFVESALRDRLRALSAGAQYTLQPIIWVTQMARSIAFYQALGFERLLESTDGRWMSMRGRAGQLALHQLDELPQPGPSVSRRTDWPPQQGRVRMCFEANAPLEVIAEHLTKAGIGRPEISDEAFGRIMWTTDPDGLAIEIAEHDAEFTKRNW